MNRVVVIAVAALVAVGSGIGLLRYVGAADDRAARDAEPVPVLVAATDIAEGTSFTEAFDAGQITLGQTLRSIKPPTAVSDPEQLTGLVATVPIATGQLVVEGTFADPSEVGRLGPPTFADRLPEGSVAVSFEAATAQAVSDLIRPGDHVNLVVQVPNASELGLPDSGGPAIVHAFSDLEIIAIGTVPAPPEGATEAPANPGTGLYTVAVDAEDAARILLLTRQYEVFLTLIGPGEPETGIPPVGRADGLPDVPTGSLSAPATAEQP